jgi:hypothetical protein
MEDIEELKTWALAVAREWATAGINVGNLATEEQITEVEAVIGFSFPMDAREFYKIANGFSNWGWDANMFSIWPLERILEEYTKERDKSFVGFADYLMCCHCIGFCKDREGIYKDVDMAEPMASSFKEAIDLINANDDRIY